MLLYEEVLKNKFAFHKDVNYVFINQFDSKIRKDIIKAEKFVLERPFLKAVALMLESKPNKLLQHLPDIALPYPVMWVEFDNQALEQYECDSIGTTWRSTDDGAVRSAFLIRQVPSGGFTATSITQHPTVNGFESALWPVTWEFDLENPEYLLDGVKASGLEWGITDKDKIATQFQMWSVHNLGWYMKHHATKKLETKTNEALIRLSNTTRPVFHLPGTDKEVNSSINLLRTELTGDPRKILFILMLLNKQHEIYIDKSEPITKSIITRRKGGRRTYKTSHSVLSVAADRVLTVKEVTDVFNAKPRGPKRDHSVVGHWCYSHRRGDDLCRHTWEALPIGKQLQECKLCGKRRWFTKSHRRGDIELGTVDKTYDMTLNRPSKAKTLVEEL